MTVKELIKQLQEIDQKSFGELKVLIQDGEVYTTNIKLVKQWLGLYIIEGDDEI